MNADRLLTIDLGTTSCKVSLFTLDGGWVAGCQSGYPLHSPEPSAAEQDPADWQAALWRALGQLAAEHPDQMRAVIGIGPTAQMNALVLLDAKGQPLGTAQSSLDQRSVPYSTRLRKELLQRVSSVYIGRNGTPGRIAWLCERRPEQVAASAHLLEARGLLIYWLTGELGADASIGVWAWLPELVEALGFPAAKLPAIYSPWYIIGRLRPDVARRFGLPQGIPVTMGTGDGASANIGAGAIRLGQGCLTLGTTGVVRCVLPEPIPFTESLPTFSFPFVDGLWLGGALYPATACLQWLRELLGRSGDSTDDAAWLESLLPGAAAFPPGAEGLIFLPFLFGLGRPGAETYASLQGLRFTHRAEHFLRSTLEGTACALRAAVEFLESRGHTVREWRATGGGMRITLWRQIVADVLGRPLQLANGDSSLGAAVLAAVGAGVFQDLSSAVDGMVQVESEVSPSPPSVSGYQQVYRDYLAHGLPVERDAISDKS